MFILREIVLVKRVGPGDPIHTRTDFEVAPGVVVSIRV